MPQLSEEDYAKFNLMLEELGPCVDKMKDVPANFVRDQIERNNQYAERTLVSPKQFAWLERLHEEFVGSADHQEPEGIDQRDGRDPRSDRDMGDDIPF